MPVVGIITIQSIVNYGNRLQNYAVERILLKRGFRVESIRISEPVLWGKIYTKAFLGMLNPSRAGRNIAFRTRKFLRFNAEKMHIKVVSRKKAQRYFSKFDYVLIGGDQLWSQGNKDYGITGYRFGSLVSEEKRIPFGVSFGSETIPVAYAEHIRPWLDQLKYHAIREVSGADIIYELTKKRARVLLDPVFTLSADEWSAFARRAGSRTKYAVALLLGGSSIKTDSAMTEICGGMEICSIHDRNSKFAALGLEEFVMMIRNAEIVFTDSFHSTAFAILFHKPFVVFPRENRDKGQMTRIENLLQIFNLDDRTYKDEKIDWFDIDYSRADEILTKERIKVDNYLNSVLGYTET